MKRHHPLRFLILCLTAIFMSSCFVYHQRKEVIIPGIDINQTLEVAKDEIAENKMSSVLTLWAIRDQRLTEAQAEEISKIYFNYIDRIDSDVQTAQGFSVWHLTWAISNMYRLGDTRVKNALRDSYRDASKRVDDLDSRLATKFFYDKELTMGDIHAGGRAYAKSHLVVPGNEKYLQSYSAFKREHEDE